MEKRRSLKDYCAIHGYYAKLYFYLHSVHSMELLAAQAGFSIEQVLFDSTEFQFWGSEQYVRGIPLTDQKAYRNGIKNSIFNDKDIEGFRKKAERINEPNEGDQACFILRKPEWRDEFPSYPNIRV